MADTKLLILLGGGGGFPIVRNDGFLSGMRHVTTLYILGRFYAWFTAWRRNVSCRCKRRYRPERHYMRGPGPKAREKQRCDVSVDRQALGLTTQYANREEDR